MKGRRFSQISLVAATLGAWIITGCNTWNKTYGGPNSDEASSVQQTADGGYIVAGVTESFGVGNKDVWLIKVDALGNKQWDKTFGSSKDEVANSVQQTTDGGYIVAGEIWPDSAGYDDFLLIKIDANGDEEWTRTFDRGFLDWALSVLQTADGGYLVAGATFPDAWLIKTDPSGNEEWDKTYGNGGYSGAHSVVKTDDGGYILAGWTQPSNGAFTDLWLIKTDALGNEQWDKSFGGSDEEGACGVQQTSDGGYIVGGRTFSYGAGGSDAWLIKTDALGEMEWDETFGGSKWDGADSIAITNDGGYILAGYTESYSAGIVKDAWLIKTDALGNKQWDKTFGGSNWDEFDAVQQARDGGYILAGTTSSYGAGGGDIWLIKTDANGVAPPVPSTQGQLLLPEKTK